MLALFDDQTSIAAVFVAIVVAKLLLHYSRWWIEELQVAWSGYNLSLRAGKATLQSFSRNRHSSDQSAPYEQIEGYLPQNLDDSLAFTPFKVSPTLTLKNRIIRAAAFGGSTIDDIIACHCEVAKGGAAMTTIAYACVSSDGITFKQQLLLNEKHDASIRQKLIAIVNNVHQYGCKISIQLTHGGGFADPAVVGSHTLAPSSIFNPAGMNWPKEMKRDDMDRISKDFTDAAVLCREAGFDAVELHCGHGYLLSQFLCPYTNRRVDEYGGYDPRRHLSGSITHRLKFPLEVLRRIRRNVGEDFPIFVKFNVHDGFEQGIQVDDVVTAARAFAKAGASMLIPSGGFVSRNGLYMLRGNVPLLAMVKAMPGMLKSLATLLLGPLFVPTTAFEACFFREEARMVKDSVSIPVCLIGGVISLPIIEGALREHFACVQMARAIIRNPEIVNSWKELLISLSKSRQKIALNEMNMLTSKCSHCNMCVVSTLDPTLGMKCVERR